MGETHAARIAKGSAYIVTQNMVVTVVGAVAFVFVARILTQTEMGVTVVLTLATVMAQILSDFGFSSGLTKYVAEYRGREEDYSPIILSGALLRIPIAGCIALIFALSSQELSQLLLNTSEYAALFGLFSIELLLGCLHPTLTSVLLGLEKIREMMVFSIVAALVRQVSAVSLLLLGYGLTGLVSGWILGDLANLILSVSLIMKGRHVKRHSIKQIVPHFKKLAKFSWPLFVASIVTSFYSWFDRAILLAYVSLQEVAVYNVALKAFNVVFLIPAAVSSRLLPYYSEQYGKDEHEYILLGAHASVRYIALLYTPLALGLMITANASITLFAGTMYAQGDMVLVVLSLFGAIGAIRVALGVLLLVYNRTTAVLLINVVSVGAGVVMSPFLLPLLGVVGMAVIRGVAMVVSSVVVVILLRRDMQIRMDWDALGRGWIAAVFMVLVVGLLELVYFSRYLLPLYILVGGGVYVMGLRFLKAVNANDIQLVRNLLGRRADPLVRFLEKIFL